MAQASSVRTPLPVITIFAYMMRSARLSIHRHLVLLPWLAAPVFLSAAAGSDGKVEAASYSLRGRGGFIENKGQLYDQHGRPNNAVLYSFDGRSYQVRLRHGGFSYERVRLDSTTVPALTARSDTDPAVRMELERIDIDLVGAAPNAAIATEGRSSYFFNYYTPGTPADGVTDVHAFAHVIYHEVYPHIDLEFTTDSAGAFKYNFIVRPGGKLADIRLRFRGARELALTNDGIQVMGRLGTFTERIPACSWTIGDKTRSMEGRFVRVPNGDIGIALDRGTAVPPGATMTIDPQPDLHWCTYYGGSGTERAKALARDTSGNIYVAGYTNSTDLIATLDTWEDTAIMDLGLPWAHNAFIGKFDATGHLVWGSFYGGGGNDFAVGLVVRDGWSIVLTGYTDSPDHIAHFDPHGLGGTSDGFIADFHMFNGHLGLSRYIGGLGYDEVYDIAATTNKGIVLCGRTDSHDMATPGAFQTSFNNSSVAGFILQLDSFDFSVDWCTYVTDEYEYTSSRCHVDGLSVDSAGNIYCVTNAELHSFPITPGSVQEELGTILICKFDHEGQLIWSTFAGGQAFYLSEFDHLSLALDGDAIAVTGMAEHAYYDHDLVTTPGAFQAGPGTGIINRDYFIICMDTTGTQLNFATYYGNGWASAFNVAHVTRIRADGKGHFYLTATVYQGHENEITTLGQDMGARHGVAFLSQFDHAGVRQWSFGIGGSECYMTGDVLPLSTGSVLLAFNSNSPGLATPGVHQLEQHDFDAVIAEIGPCTDTVATTGPVSGPTTFCKYQYGLIFQTDPVPGAIQYDWIVPPGAIIVGNATGPSVMVNLANTPGVVGVRARGVCNTGPLRTVPVEFAPNSFLTIGYSGPPPVCSGDVGQLQATGGNGNYVWSDQSTGSTLTVSANGNYHVTSVDDNGCPLSSNTVLVSLIPTPVPLILGPTSPIFYDPTGYRNVNQLNGTTENWSCSGAIDGFSGDTTWADWMTIGPGWISVHEIASATCDGWDTLFVNVGWDPNGIDQNDPSGLRVFPTLADEEIIVDPGASPDCDLWFDALDVNGRSVLNGSRLLQGIARIDVSGLSDGPYILRILRRRSEASYRFQVLHDR